MLDGLLAKNVELFNIVSSTLNLNDINILSCVCKIIRSYVTTALLKWYRAMLPVHLDIKNIKYTNSTFMSIRGTTTYHTISGGPKNHLVCTRKSVYHTLYEDKHKVYSIYTALI